MNVQFVEVPPNAKTVPYAPKTPYASDANRKAGPLRTGRGAAGAPGPIYSRPAPPARPAAPPQQAPRETIAPAMPAPQQYSSAGDLPQASRESREQRPSESLAKSLNNLDRFIQPSPGEATSGGGGGEGGDGMPAIPPGSGVFFDTRGYDLGPWANRVIAIVKSNWLTPEAAKLGARGIVSISFTVARSGRIDNIRLVSSSGIPSFDTAAMNALRSSSPLPKLPVDFPRPILPGLFRFFYNTPVEENNNS